MEQTPRNRLLDDSDPNLSQDCGDNSAKPTPKEIDDVPRSSKRLPALALLVDDSESHESIFDLDNRGEDDETEDDRSHQTHSINNTIDHHVRKEEPEPNQSDEEGFPESNSALIAHEGVMEDLDFGGKFMRTMKKMSEKFEQHSFPDSVKTSGGKRNQEATREHEKGKEKALNIVEEICNDFTTGDKKILRAIGRTAAVNAAVLATALTGGAGGAAGLVAGGAITAKRFGDAVEKEDEKEVAKSLAVYGSATTASIAGQALTGAILLGATGVALPIVGVVAFGVGCVSGITAGALSEWGVDSAMNSVDKENIKDK